MPTPSKLQWTILASYAVNAFCTFYSMTGKWTNGCTNQSQSNSYFTLITPPGWAFAIWGVIFTWELLGCLTAFVPQWNSFSSPIVDNKFGLFWGLACVIQAVWPIVFCDSIQTSWAVLVAAWVALLALQQTSLRKFAAQPSTVSTSTKVAQYVMLVAPFSLHLGWVTAASALNVNLAFVAAVSTPITLITVALCSLIFITAMGWTFGLTGLSWTQNSADPMMAAGVVWALNAVSKHDVNTPIITSVGPQVFSTEVTTPVASAATFVAVLLSSLMVIRLKVEGINLIVRKYRSHKKSQDDAAAAVYHLEENSY